MEPADAANSCTMLRIVVILTNPVVLKFNSIIQHYFNYFTIELFNYSTIIVEKLK